MDGNEREATILYSHRNYYGLESSGQSAPIERSHNAGAIGWETREGEEELVRKRRDGVLLSFFISMAVSLLPAIHKHTNFTTNIIIGRRRTRTGDEVGQPEVGWLRQGPC